MENCGLIKKILNATKKIVEKPMLKYINIPLAVFAGHNVYSQEASKLDSILNYFNEYNIIYHTSESKLVGKYAEVYKKYSEFAMQNPAFLRFGNSLDNDDSRYPKKLVPKDKGNKGLSARKMIPSKLEQKADSVACKLYKEFCKKNEVNPKELVNFIQFPEKLVGGHIDPDNIEGLGWIAKIYVGSKGVYEYDKKGNKYYSPKEITALHELDHLQRYKGFGKDKGCLNAKDIAINETATMINEIINNDFVYKKIKNIPLDSVVIYPENLPSNKKGGIPLGILANTFRTLKEKYGTVEESLMSKEGQEFVKRYYKN